MTMTETIERSTQERIARVGILKEEVMELYKKITDVENEYGTEYDMYPDHIAIPFREWVKRASEIRKEMHEIQEQKKLDDMYSKIDVEIENLIHQG